MGMYTELIFGASLKENTPIEVINAIKYIIGETEVKPDDFPLPEGRCEWLLNGSSYYFGVSSALNKLWFDDIGKTWILSSRSSIKNYENEIQTFLEWIEPYIESGSGDRDMYAVVTYEDGEPELFYLHDS